MFESQALCASIVMPRRHFSRKKGSSNSDLICRLVRCAALRRGHHRHVRYHALYLLPSRGVKGVAAGRARALRALPPTPHSPSLPPPSVPLPLLSLARARARDAPSLWPRFLSPSVHTFLRARLRRRRSASRSLRSSSVSFGCRICVQQNTRIVWALTSRGIDANILKYKKEH